ncbi:MAG: tetratricopeptide repeat protein [Desulfovibrio sp.]|nr:MAG: tetratricopeptide repeat protein [Desulfovibrio sp.]
MAQLKTLLDKLPVFSETRMVSNGFGVWLAWKTELNPAVHQTLSDYGGLVISQDRHQSLWFFFSSDVFLALAKLEIWARLNPIPVFVQVAPAKLLLGLKLERSLAMEANLATQDAMVPDEFEVWVHPKASETAKAIPGISFAKAAKRSGLAPLNWQQFQADPRLPYQSSLGWYLVLKPLGNPLDKTFLAGWRDFYEELDILLKRMKLKFMLHEFYLMFPLENLRQLRAWCKEYLGLMRRLKDENKELYWPCVQAVADKKGLNFNAELPGKFNLDWGQLMPDFPHMSYRTAFLMGEGFRINDVRFSVDQGKVEDWCNVSLTGDFAEGAGVLPVELPKRLVAGRNPNCFYCGLRTHEPTDCPSRAMASLDTIIWEHVAQIGFEDMQKGLLAMDDALATKPEQGVAALMEGDAVPNKLMRALFEINAPVQLRMAQTVMRSLGKEYPKGLSQLGPAQGEFIWEGLEALRAGEHMQADRIFGKAMLKHPRMYQARTLQGYVALERGDPAKAVPIWQEAEAMSNTPLQQAYLIFLQARGLEITGKYQAALAMYKNLLNTSPRWLDGLYRQGVCLVKMGFADQAMGFFEDLIQRDPHMFNRVLFDPELERGHLQLLTAMHGPFATAEAKADEEKQALEEIDEEVAKWFPKDHAFAEEAGNRIGLLQAQGDVRNFVAFNRVVQGRMDLSRDLMGKIDDESKALREYFESLMGRLREVRGEASWFPFPRLLVDFNKDFNFCAKSLNWAMGQHFQLPEKFRKAQEISDKIEEKLVALETRLKTLKVVRDATLFILIMGKTFFWLEILGLVASLLLLPLGVYLGQQTGQEWASGLVERQKWELQKGMIIILSVSALAISVLRSVLVFDKKRTKLFEKMEAQEQERARQKAAAS